MVLRKVKSKFQVLFYKGSGELKARYYRELRFFDSKYKKFEIKRRFQKKLMF